MVYYHTEDEWEQTMEVIFLEKKGAKDPLYSWGWVSLMWEMPKFLPSGLLQIPFT